MAECWVDVLPNSLCSDPYDDLVWLLYYMGYMGFHLIDWACYIIFLSALQFVKLEFLLFSSERN